MVRGPKSSNEHRHHKYRMAPTRKQRGDPRAEAYSSEGGDPLEEEVHEVETRLDRARSAISKKTNAMAIATMVMARGSAPGGSPG